jgi:tetratricopeptide (TPR) repeat protein
MQSPENHDHHGASLKNKGKIYTLQGHMSKGMKYHKQAIEFYNRTGLTNSLRMAQIYHNIGECHEVSGQKDLAADYYDCAI